MTMVIATVIRLSLLVMSVKAIYVTNVGLTPVSLAAEGRRLHAEVMRIRFVVNSIKAYHRNKIYWIVERARRARSELFTIMSQLGARRGR